MKSIIHSNERKMTIEKFYSNCVESFEKKQIKMFKCLLKNRKIFFVQTKCLKSIEKAPQIIKGFLQNMHKRK